MSLDRPFVLQEALHADSLKQKPTQQVLQAQKQMLDRLRALHTHAQQLLQQNEQAAEREQLPRGDLVVDVAGMGRLKALGYARIAAVREGILRAGLEQALVWERLKELGWDSMEEHQATLTGIKSNVEVWCFPKNCSPMHIVDDSINDDVNCDGHHDAHCADDHHGCDYSMALRT